MATSNEKYSSSDPIVAMVAAVPSYGTETVTIDEDAVNHISGGAVEEEAPLTLDHTAYNGDENGGKFEAPVYQDVAFAVLFLAHLGVMLWLGMTIAPAGYEKIELNMTLLEQEIRSNSDDVTSADLEKMEQFAQAASDFMQVYPRRIIANLVYPCLMFAFVISLVATVCVMKPWPKPFCYASLVGTIIGTAFVLISAAVSSQSAPMYLLGGVALVGVMYYVALAWRMVPFAAVNLKVALEGISNNWGIYIIAFVFAKLGLAWNMYWLYVVVGLAAAKNSECMEEHPDLHSTFEDTTCGPPPLVFLALLLSLYWTSTVMMNTVQVTVAGVMGTWCFVSEDADKCCSPAVLNSLGRSFTYSFGSICLGSLLQAVVSVLRCLAESARRQRDDQNAVGSFLACVCECLARCLEDALEYFNQWAYVFVGIYGLSYLESGRKVVELFRAVGWTSIVTDNLVGYALGLATFTVGVISGLAGVITDHTMSNKNNDADTESQSYFFGPLPGATGGHLGLASWSASGLHRS